MLLKKVIQLSPTTVADIKSFMATNVPVEKDVSNYAPGRERGWLQHEGPLSMNRKFQPRPCPTRLWSWLGKIWQSAGYTGLPELGLAAHGDRGISLHRDATYAAPASMLVNLGGVTWGYEPTREATRPQYQKLEGGEVLTFDCKHRHAALDPSPDRWSIILWQVSNRRRAEFDRYLKTLKPASR